MPGTKRYSVPGGTDKSDEHEGERFASVPTGFAPENPTDS
jgi:hypothetical protein